MKPKMSDIILRHRNSLSLTNFAKQIDLMRVFKEKENQLQEKKKTLIGSSNNFLSGSGGSLQKSKKKLKKDDYKSERNKSPTNFNQQQHQKEVFKKSQKVIK
jgi:hypothetical protein